jgi:DNA mismatch repair protein MSH5
LLLCFDCDRQLLRNHDLNPLLDESITEEEERDLRDAEAVCRRYLQWDFTKNEEDELVSVKDRLREILGRDPSNANDDDIMEE